MKVGDLLPPISRTLRVSGTATDLTTADTIQFRLVNMATGETVFQKDAAVVQAAQGKVRYDWEAGDTDVAGQYRMEWYVVFPGPLPITYPNDDETIDLLQIYGAETLSTPVTDIIEMARTIVDDDDPDVQQIEDAQLINGIKLALITEEDLWDYTMVGQTIVPPISDDKAAYALLIWTLARKFAMNISRNSYRTRAFAESRGDAKELVSEILQRIYVLQNGAMTG